MAVNLLPSKYQPRPLIDWKRLRNIFTIIIIIFSLVFTGTYYYFYRSGLKETQANLEQNINNLKPVFTKIQGYEETMKSVEKIKAVADKIGKAREIWSDILVDIAGSLERDIWFVEISKENNQVIITGEAKDFTAVGNLAVNLRKLPWFKGVDISSADKITGELQIQSNSNNRMVISENTKFIITAFLQDSIDLFTPSQGGVEK